MQEQGILRQCVLYPGCFVSFDGTFEPTAIRVCEINIRPGEPEFQPIVKRLRNLGALMQAMVAGNLHEVAPEVRGDQISLCLALVTGPGGPKQQKGYPWSLTKGEVLEIDFDYFDKKKITVIPSAMDYVEGVFKSDGSRVAYLVANATVKAGQNTGPGGGDPAPAAARRLRQRQDPGHPPGKRPGQPAGPKAGYRPALSEGRRLKGGGSLVSGQARRSDCLAVRIPFRAI